MRQRPKPLKPKAKVPVARKALNDEDARVRDLEKRLAEALKGKSEALDQQTATAEILRVISRSPSNVQPVFDTIAQSAVRLCDAVFGAVYRVEGGQIHMVAETGIGPEGLARAQRIFPIPVATTTGDSAVARAILERSVVQVSDSEAPEAPRLTREAGRVIGFRSQLTVPMLRDGEPIGTVNVARREPGAFSQTQVELLKTFADQAVIAIENVRLFNETREALEQQTATSEILRVISQSPTTVEPVFGAIVRSAAALCHAPDVVILVAEGDSLRFGASVGPVAASVQQSQLIRGRSLSLTRGSVSGRAVIDQRTVHIHDVSAMPDDEFPEGKRLQQEYGGRGTTLAVPLLHDNESLGVITLLRNEVRPFTDQQVALLETFADQAVIAIENVRLFTELQEKNRALTEAHAEVTQALDRQTATSGILRAISQSQTDTAPVFEAIVDSAVRLLRAYTGGLTRVVGEQIVLEAFTRTDAAGDAALQGRFPMPVVSNSSHALTLRDRAPLNVADADADPRLSVGTHRYARVRGYRSQLVVPLLRQADAIGTISVTRREPGGFEADEIALIQTFADQAVIALENVRLFRELEGANRELSVASQHKSEFLANMSHELRTPLNAIIGFSEVLTERMFGELNEKQEEYLKDIHASGTHLLSLINDILDLSKIEAGRMELELSDFHLPTALDNAMMLVRERAGRRGIALHLSIDERLRQMRADERKIRQVVLNLLSNAIKFTPEGGRIEVGAMPKDGFVEVSVSDTGVGIAPEDQEAVFEEFRQVGTADKKAEGTGLGLALCRKFIELHGGRIWVKSQPGQGATFTFTIPVRRRGE